MNKKQFLEKLHKNLFGISKDEITDILADFEEYFEIGKERGRSEEDIIISLGNPKQLARQIKAESFIKKAEQNISSSTITKAVFTTIGLSFFNLIVILPVFLIIIGFLAFLFASSISISATGISGAVLSLFYPLFEQYLTFKINNIALFFAFIGVGSTGILFFVGNIYFTKLLYRKFLKYLKFNVNFIKQKSLKKSGGVIKNEI